MTEQEVLNEIFETYKWWVGFCSRDYAGVLKHRYNTTTLNQNTIDNIIKHCGYEILTHKTYTKKN